MTEAFVEGNWGKLWTISTGAGLPILLCNGGPGCCDYLAPVAYMLDQTTQVIRFEQRGCGRSDHIPPYDVESCLADLETIRRHYHCERWMIAGHSWGADLALSYALQYPEQTLGLVCISGGRVHNDRDWHQVYRQKRDQGLETPPAYEYPPNLEVNEQVNRSWKRYIQQPSLLKKLARLDRPALFIYGDQDIRPSWPVEQVAHLLPQAKFELIPGADHYIWVTHFEQMKAILNDFVSQFVEIT